MTQRLPITIRLESFEGPLDLLLYLIQSHELEISKISIRKITDQYLAYVQLMQELNFDVASDFLVMAATLVYWKSRALLPQEETAQGAIDAGDIALTPEELLNQLREHQRFLQMGRDLNSLSLLGDDVFKRPNTKLPATRVWKLADVSSLALTYQDLLVRERKRKTILKKETVSLSTKISHFADRLSVGAMTGMYSLIDDIKSRPEVVVTFLASLELARLKKLKLYQEGMYQEIYVELLESLKNFDPKLASGFDSIQEQVENGINNKSGADNPTHTPADDGNTTTVAAAIDTGAGAPATGSAHTTGSDHGLTTLIESATNPTHGNRDAGDHAHV